MTIEHELLPSERGFWTGGPAAIGRTWTISA
jgi:hypothetical protein